MHIKNNLTIKVLSWVLLPSYNFYLKCLNDQAFGQIKRLTFVRMAGGLVNSFKIETCYFRCHILSISFFNPGGTLPALAQLLTRTLAFIRGQAGNHALLRIKPFNNKTCSLGVETVLAFLLELHSKKVWVVRFNNIFSNLPASMGH